jgi:hypothetical protein
MEIKHMSAGLSKKQINGRIYRHLQTIKRNLELAGVHVSYRKYQLCRFEQEGTQKIGGFNISYSVSHASNGEVAGVPVVYITGTMQPDARYGGWTDNHGTFVQGIANIVNQFSEPEVKS